MWPTSGATGAYKVFWDPDKANGLGDIAIERVDLLNVFWEPGKSDLQESRYLFHTRLEDNDRLEEAWPQLKGKLKNSGFTATRFLYDDAVPTDGKSTVIEVYYKKHEGGRDLLHYCRYVGDTLLYASENVKDEQGLYHKARRLRRPVSEQRCAAYQRASRKYDHACQGRRHSQGA